MPEFINAFNFGKKFKSTPAEREGGVIFSNAIISAGIITETKAISRLIDLLEYCCSIKMAIVYSN